MTKLTERYVQEKALNFLRNFYSEKNPDKPIFARIEVATTYKRKLGRADGLLAFKQGNDYIYTISVEAKSHKTFDSLIRKSRDRLFLFLLGFSFISFAVISWITLGATAWWLKIMIAVPLSLVISAALLAILEKKNIFDTHDIIQQVKRYPADEKWIAISKDAYNIYNKTENGLLISHAQTDGIGVLVVSNSEKVVVELYPKMKSSRNGYIRYYKINEKIKKYLYADSATGQQILDYKE